MKYKPLQENFDVPRDFRKPTTILMMTNLDKMIQINDEITYHRAYYRPQSDHLQPCFNIEEFFAFEYSNQSLWHGQGNAGRVLSVNRWWGWTFLRIVGPCPFAISPFFQNFSYNLCWWVKLFENLKDKLKKLCVDFERNMLPFHQSQGNLVKMSFWEQANPDEFLQLQKLHWICQAQQISIWIPRSAQHSWHWQPPNEEKGFSLLPGEWYPLQRYRWKDEPHPDPCWFSGCNFLN